MDSWSFVCFVNTVGFQTDFVDTKYPSVWLSGNAKYFETLTRNLTYLESQMNQDIWRSMADDFRPENQQNLCVQQYPA